MNGPFEDNWECRSWCLRISKGGSGNKVAGPYLMAHRHWTKVTCLLSSFLFYFRCSCWTKWSSQFVTWYHISVLTSRELDCLKISRSNRISSKVARVIWRVMTYTDLPTTICTNEHNRIPLTVPGQRTEWYISWAVQLRLTEK